jgi:hypothetical protein
MSQLEELLERVRAAKDADQSLDADICVDLQYGGGGSEGAVNVRTDPDWEGELLFEIGTEDCVNPIPPITASIDAALALVERVLPGWAWMVQKIEGVPTRGALRDCEADLWIPSAKTQGLKRERARSDGATHALAILAALLSALIAQRENAAAKN